MEALILSRLDEMFEDLRQDVLRQHVAQVHASNPVEHESRCSSNSSSNQKSNANRRHSTPASSSSNRRDSVTRVAAPADATDRTAAGRRRSLPAGHERTTGAKSSLPIVQPAAHAAPHPRRSDSSVSSLGRSRKFSRDSIDLEVIEDVGEWEDESVIVEEDENQLDDEVLGDVTAFP